MCIQHYSIGVWKCLGPALRETARLSQPYPPLARYGVFGVSQHGQWPIGCDTPSPFLSVSPLESMQSGGAIPPPPQRGYLSDTCVKTSGNKAKCVRCPLSRKGIARYEGLPSHWAAELETSMGPKWLPWGCCGLHYYSSFGKLPANVFFFLGIKQRKNDRYRHWSVSNSELLMLPMPIRTVLFPCARPLPFQKVTDS